MITLTVRHNLTEISGDSDEEVRVAKKSLNIWVRDQRTNRLSHVIRLYKGNRFLTGYLSRFTRKLEKREIPYEIVDLRIYPGTGQEKLNLKKIHDLRDHQADALDAIKNSNGVGLISAPTASGKSDIIYQCVDHFKHVALIIVPTNSIQNKMYHDLRKRFGPTKVSKSVPERPPEWALGSDISKKQNLGSGKNIDFGYMVPESKARDIDFGFSSDETTKKEIDFGYGQITPPKTQKKAKGFNTKKQLKNSINKKKRWFKPITVLCWQSLAQVPQWYLDEVGLIIIDECHTGSIESIRKCLWRAPNAAYKLGFSATAWRDKDHEKELLRAALGENIIYEYSVVEAMDEGMVASVNLKVINSEVPRVYLKKMRNPRDIMDNCIVHNETRNYQIAGLAEERLQEAKGVYIAVDEVKHGENLRDILIEKGIEPVFIHGRLPKRAREDLENFLRSTDEPFICIGSPAIGVGTDIPTINSVILASWGKSTIRFIQNIGRGMRAEELEVFMFWDWFNPVTERHSREKLRTFGKYYKRSAMF